MNRKTMCAVAAMISISFLVGCATQPIKVPVLAAPQPVGAPGPGYTLIVDNLLVIADVSRSMRCDDKFGMEKAILTSFNSGIPQGLDNAGLRTFGKSTYDYSVLVTPVQPYERQSFGDIINKLEPGCDGSPLGYALKQAQDDLAKSEGRIAVLVISDAENLPADPFTPAQQLKELYGDRLCIHTIHVGQDEYGAKILEAIARHSGCGIAVKAEDLQSAESMKNFITDVFYGKGGELDSDGDGVLDSADKCPNTPRGVKVDANGCPLDSDGDGVPDYLDKCPGTPAGVKVDQNGCPFDSDGDGVLDYLDKCPDTPRGATVDMNGCWAIQGITFEYDKSDIRPEFYPVLDQNAQVLLENSGMKVEIQGHTDSAGSDSYNQALSERRAAAVKQYFVSKGVEAERMSTRGFGESQPIATNATPEGRAQNRRVAIEILSR